MTRADPTAAPTPRQQLAQRLALAAALAGLAGLALWFWSTAISTSWGRIAALRTIEPYAFAVQEQLLYNFSRSGEFFQTIHRGYDDNWMWSGHRAATLVLSGLFYKLSSGPLWLSGIQITAVTLGVVPAAALGRLALRHYLGLLLGGALYLLSPAVMALALQDYQDLVFALPCLLFTLWAMRARRPWLVALGALAGCLPREEALPAVLACAVVSLDLSWPRPWHRWGRNLLITAGVVLAWGGALALFFPVAEGAHDMPLAASLGKFLDPQQKVVLFGRAWLGDFYALCWAPLGLAGLLSPHTLLPGAGLLLMHLTVPIGHGVDRAWSGHAHHMAPILPFFLAATILGLGRLLRWAGHPRLRWPWLRRGLPWLLAALCAAYVLRWELAWARYFNLVLSPLPRAPAYWHPAWQLARQLPADAVPAVPVVASLTVSARPRSYTFGESLLDKVPEKGLAAATHLIVHEDNERVEAWGLAMPGAELLTQEGPYLLIGWPPGGKDPNRATFLTGQPPETIPSWDFEPDRVWEIPGVAPPGPQHVTGYEDLPVGVIGR